MATPLQYCLTLTHLCTHRWWCQPRKVTASSSGAVKVRCLAQGHIDNQLGGTRGSRNLPVIALPPEPHASILLTKYGPRIHVPSCGLWVCVVLNLASLRCPVDLFIKLPSYMQPCSTEPCESIMGPGLNVVTCAGLTQLNMDFME